MNEREESGNGASAEQAEADLSFEKLARASAQRGKIWYLHRPSGERLQRWNRCLSEDLRPSAIGMCPSAVRK